MFTYYTTTFKSWSTFCLGMWPYGKPVVSFLSVCDVTFCPFGVPREVVY